MASDDKHLILPRLGRSIAFTPVGKPIHPIVPEPVDDRPEHARNLIERLHLALRGSSERLDAQSEVLPRDRRGLLLVLRPRDGSEIDLSFFRGTSHKIELLAASGRGRRQRVRVFVPERRVGKITEAIAQYGDWEEGERKPRFTDFFEQLGDINLAAVSRFWNGPEDASMPSKKDVADWEVWIRPAVAEDVKRVAPEFDVSVDPHATSFSRVVVMQMRARFANLERLLIATASVIELRPASELTVPPMSMTPVQRRNLASVLAGRIVPAPEGAPLTTIFDTGVRYQHVMLRASLPEARAHTLLPAWQKDDTDGHGTQMAGAALFGDLEKLIRRTDPIVLQTALESVTVLGASGSRRFNPSHQLREAIRRVERTPGRRIYSLSLGMPNNRNDGLPTEFSSTIDQLAFGDDTHKRLFCVAAGNLAESGDLVVGDYIGTNDATGIQTPGQAANALTVGAYTEKTDAEWGERAHAPRGDLCPSSRTAIAWRTHLAHKPDIVMEGGNRVVEADGVSTRMAESLCVLTTHNEIPGRPFAAAAETSIANAAAAGMATRVAALYPELWPETIRGLMVHSARWTPAMLNRWEGSTRAAAQDILRRFGWGVPSEERMRRSVDNVLTLIEQDRLSPFTQRPGGKPTYDKMNFYRLPWPREALDSIASEKVKLRITLSYFAEPFPSAITFDSEQDYFSHGLTFDVCEPDDDDNEAIARVNGRHRRAGHRPGGKRRRSRWILGSEARAVGTLRQDVWEGTAGDLATMNRISVVPERGWWSSFRTGKDADETVRYALIVSIEAPEAAVDLLTETSQAIAQLRTPVEV